MVGDVMETEKSNLKNNIWGQTYKPVKIWDYIYEVALSLHSQNILLKELFLHTVY